MEFKVEGIWLATYQQAITLAQRKAEEYGRAIEIVTRNSDWIATMKPAVTS